MIKDEYYLLIRGEDDKRISEEQYISLKEMMKSSDMPYFTELNGNVYHTRDLQLRKIKQKYL